MSLSIHFGTVYKKVCGRIEQWSGYEVDFDIATVLCESSPGFTFYSLLDLNATSGGVTFSRDFECYSWCSSYLFDTLTSLDETYEYFHYQDTNLLFYMDFGYIIDREC